MKTPAEILLEYTLGGYAEHSENSHDAEIIWAMKEYAKQWVDRSVEIADMNIDPTEIHSRISALSKEIDAQ